MLCESCNQRQATVHITEVVEAAPNESKHHFCEPCAEQFQKTDIIQRMLRRFSMIKLRVTEASPDRTLLVVLGGRHDGETWTFVTDRLARLHIEPSERLEFEIQEDQAYIEWLKGERESLE